ncbi:Peroxisome size and maintenance regulator, partial [Oleoguttula sp. CCFEE 5521]
MDRDEDDDGGIIANRDDAIPVLRIPSRTTDLEQAASDSSQDKREGLRDRIKNKLNDAAAPSIQDRLFTSLMAQIIPPEELSENEGDASQATPGKKDRRSRTYVDRPNFSVGMMSGNFRRFNSRVGIIFVFQNRLIHLFTWRHPPATLSFLAVYTLICLDPYLLPIIPIALVLFFVMLPSFLARHPAPNSPQT